MKSTILKKVIAGSFVVFSSVSLAGAAIVQNDLSGLAPLTTTSGNVTGISLSPFAATNGGLYAYYDSSISSFVIRENGTDFIGVGSHVPVGTDLTNFMSGFGDPSNFALSNPSGDYFFPAEKGLPGGSPYGSAYVSASYDNVSQRLSFVSSTVQDVAGDPLIVSAIPEASSTFLVLFGAGALVLRRRR